MSASRPFEARMAGADLPPPAGEIVFERVTYFPPGAKPGDDAIIKGASFRIAPGECVAIIGPSRAGKSTLMRLMAGAVRPTQGIVRYDNADIAHWEDAARGRYVGYLAQDVEFLPGTLSMNIARFDPDADTDAVIAAARSAGAHTVIMAQARNYDTPLGPGGVRLSGGEAQLTGLARALYGDPRILILDEPNASLDHDGDMALEAAMAAAKAAGTTIVFTTHRPALTRFADKILVMQRGQIEMFGPAREVMERLQGRQAPSPSGAPGVSPAQPPAGQPAQMPARRSGLNVNTPAIQGALAAASAANGASAQFSGWRVSAGGEACKDDKPDTAGQPDAAPGTVSQGTEERR